MGICIQKNETASLLASGEKSSEKMFEYYLEVKRILYIGDVIYTISERKVKLNSIGDLALLKEIELT